MSAGKGDAEVAGALADYLEARFVLDERGAERAVARLWVADPGTLIGHLRGAVARAVEPLLGPGAVGLDELVRRAGELVPETGPGVDHMLAVATQSLDEGEEPSAAGWDDEQVDAALALLEGL